jgi:hypothetical protein
MLLVRSHCRAIDESKYDEENLKVDVGADGTEPGAVESSSGLLLAAWAQSNEITTVFSKLFIRRERGCLIGRRSFQPGP